MSLFGKKAGKFFGNVMKGEKPEMFFLVQYFAKSTKRIH